MTTNTCLPFNKNTGTSYLRKLPGNRTQSFCRPECIFKWNTKTTSTPENNRLPNDLAEEREHNSKVFQVPEEVLTYFVHLQKHTF